MSRFVLLVAVAMAIVGTLVAFIVPASGIELFLREVIGDAGTVQAVPWAHRLSAAGGALLGASAIVHVARAKERPVLRVSDRALWLVAVPLSLLVLMNARWAGIRMGWWSAAGQWTLGPAYNALLAVFVVGAWVGLVPAIVRHRREHGSGLVAGMAAGAAYGAFSTLWHCCPPLWHQGWSGPILVLGTVAPLAYVASVGARWRRPIGECAAALLLGVVYPWHTPLWFVQCLIGGAFATWIARRAGSALAPGMFLATAFLTHMTLPFIGNIAVAVVGLAVVIHCAAMTVAYQGTQVS